MIALCHHIKPLLLLVLSIAALSCHAQSDADSRLDSTEISLLTCSPHQEVYSLYGHTAIRVRNAVTGEDLVVNYGVFDFAQPHFVTRFVFGLTDYSMGIMPFSLFYQEYRYYNSSVTQQTLNLTRAEKQNILKALADNAQSPTYRYNYFHDNCTTRARDMLTQHLDGEVHYQGAADSSATFRSMIHDFNEQHPWARFGNDMLLGFGADRRTTRSETQFLPTNLMDDFATATIEGEGGSRPLVKETREVVPGGVQVVESEFPLRPLSCFLLLLVVTLLVIAIEWKTGSTLWGYDAIVLTLSGLAGIVLTLMIFSHHPTVSLNLQLLLLNPLPLLLVIPVVRKTRRHQQHWWWKAWSVLIILFFVGSFIQKYAEGMFILALSLLCLCIWRLQKNSQKRKMK